ncbi:IclR family transcriptional regulator [Microbispora amethystogenes]|uniref:IclR family transcriptional regulator n=2 Tax=Microbispora TaxID=2005 RepID=A0A5J5KCI3_9ACTN|nr:MULTISPECIES: IclR family transcriptional regulator [Microbispora]KAA9381538.1 IclR family transcriptional regulator [Microbispora cellulosiformans]GIH30482.1 IclR family transcriptional regulator [Microbispora amethystogenes]
MLISAPFEEREEREDPARANGSASGLGRALQVIYAVGESGPEGVGVSALAREVGLSKAVAHRILKVLSDDGFLSFESDTKRYTLGPGALQVGLAALRQLDIQRIVRPLLERLVAVTDETATLSVRQRWSRIYVDQVLSPQEIRMSVTLGHPYPLHAGASSKALLAAMDDEEITRYLATHSLDHVTATTISSRDQLLAEVAMIRRRGYAVSTGEREAGAASIAAAVLGAGGRVLGAISVCGPLHRFQTTEMPHYGALVAGAAQEASRAAGYRP